MELKAAEISDYPGYLITPDGSVLSKKTYPELGKVEMKPCFGAGSGKIKYLLLSLVHRSGKKKTCFVHRLVADAFLPPKPFDEAVIRHLDGNVRNNHYSNLAWGSRKDDGEDESHYLLHQFDKTQVLTYHEKSSYFSSSRP